jgi:hypothetical protein
VTLQSSRQDFAASLMDCASHKDLVFCNTSSLKKRPNMHLD